MFRIKCPEEVNLSRFSPELSADGLEAKYGLPKYVAFCKRCVISNQRPNSTVEYRNKPGQEKAVINFDADGVCDACKMADIKNIKIDWDSRERELRDLCDRYRRNDGRYDCIVPGSGGKDSFFASHILRNKYGMNPLTVTWAPHIYTDWGFRNFQKWIHSGFDNHLVTPNGRVHRLLTRLATDLLYHPFQPFFFGQKSIAPKMAIDYDIPLVFYGENEAEYGNPILSSNSAQQDWSYFSSADTSQVYLSGVSVSSLIEDFGLSKADLLPYMPADPNKLSDFGVQVHYLGYYLKWHPQSCYYYSVEHGGFEAAPERNPGTYGKYASIDDKIDDFHFYTTGVKFGIGHATYDASQEIRSGDIERDDGVALVKRFDIEFPERFAEEIFRYLSIQEKEFPVAAKQFECQVMDAEYFRRLTDNHRSPHLWKWEGDRWVLRHAVWHGVQGDV